MENGRVNYYVKRMRILGLIQQRPIEVEKGSGG